MDNISDIRRITCCFTGHRRLPRDQYKVIEWRVQTEIEKRIDMGFKFFCCGGAMGFDMMCELAVLRAKRLHPDKGIELHLYLPREDVASQWPDKRRWKFEHDILPYADKVSLAGSSTDYFTLMKRNHQLVNASCCCIAYCERWGKGGTSFTFNYAYDEGLELVNIAHIV